MAALSPVDSAFHAEVISYITDRQKLADLTQISKKEKRNIIEGLKKIFNNHPVQRLPNWRHRLLNAVRTHWNTEGSVLDQKIIRLVTSSVAILGKAPRPKTPPPIN